MVYSPTTWTDEVLGATPAKYVITDDTAGEIAASATIDLATAPTPGTPVDATHLNNIEDGIVTLESDLASTAADLVTFQRVIWGDRSGVVSGLTVAESSPAAKSVTVAPGNVVIREFARMVVTADTRVVAIADNTSGNPRIDVIVARATWSTGLITLAVLQGTPGAVPVAPALTQTVNTVWEEALAQVAVADSFATIVNANLTDWRRIVSLEARVGKTELLLSATVPEGWLLCYGQAVSRTHYADLFVHLGSGAVWGAGDSSTTFNLPDLRGRVPAGLDNMGGSSANVVTNAAADSMAGTMGEDLHTPIEAEMFQHNHALNNGTLVARKTGAAGATDELGGSAVNTTIGTLTTANKGSSTPFNVVQPTVFVNWMIKT